MSFLAPLFLVGALAIVGPILFHMIRRSPEKRRDFSSLIFLEPDPPVFSRRNRITNWILLLLRCLVVALICLAFSRPFFRHEEKTLVAGGLVQHHLVLMDRSASMQRNGLAKSLEAAMDDIIRTVKSGDSILLASFSDQFNVHGDWQAFETGITRDELLSMSESIELTSRSTLLGKSMVQGYQALVDRMAETSSQGFRVSGTIHLISDFQRGAQMDQLQGIEWTENINVVIHSIAGDLPGNAGLSLLSSDRAQILRLQVSNDIESSASTFQVLVKGASEISGAPAGEPRRYPVVVPPGSTRVLSIPLEEISWTHGTAELLGDDASPFDNVVYWSTSTAGSFRLLVHGLGEENTPGSAKFFLAKAFQDGVNAPVLLETLPTLDDIPAGPQFLVVSGMAQANQVPGIHQRILDGMDLLWIPGSVEEIQQVSSQIIHGKPDSPDGLQASLTQSRKLTLLEVIQWQHPVFSAFRDPQFSNFSKVGFHRYFRLEPEWIEKSGGAILASLEGGHPWLVEWNLGSGRLWMMTSGWDVRDSVLARSSKFVPLILSLAQSTGAWRANIPHYLVGQPWEPFTGDVSVMLADGGVEEIPAGRSLPGIATPGFVRVDNRRNPIHIPVNLDPRESLCSPTAADNLADLGVPIENIPALKSTPDEDELSELTITQKDFEVEKAQKNWKWIVAFVLGLLVVETGLAGSTQRRQSARVSTGDKSL